MASCTVLHMMPLLGVKLGVPCCREYTVMDRMGNKLHLNF